MNASFGIDHPLLATHDIDTLRELLITLGFNMTAVGRHPWGTSTSLAMFDGCLLEIMGIYNEQLIDEVPAGEFRFGRHVYEHLLEREGVALSALHSTDSVADAKHAQRAGFTVAGHLEFGRDVTLPDGATDRTKTTLALLPDAQFPRLSFFLCQQHRPELIYVPQWLEHPNRVVGIAGINIVADETHQTALHSKLESLYTDFRDIEAGFQCQTANGVIRVMNQQAFDRNIGNLAKPIMKESTPCIAGMDFEMSDAKILFDYLKRSGLGFTRIDTGYTLNTPELTANTTLRFCNFDLP